MVEHRYAHTYSYTLGPEIALASNAASDCGLKVVYPVLLVSGFGASEVVKDFVDTAEIRAVSVPELYGVPSKALAHYLEEVRNKFDKDLDTLSFVVVSTYLAITVEINDRNRLVRHLSRLALSNEP